jgi:hypothetical protein
MQKDINNYRGDKAIKCYIETDDDEDWIDDEDEDEDEDDDKENEDLA